MRLLLSTGAAMLVGIAGAREDVQRCYEETEDLKLKVSLCTRAIESGELGNQNLAVSLVNRGIARRRLGQDEAAIADYSRAIELSPRLVSAYYNRGIARQGLGDDRAAAEDFGLTITLKPDYAPAYLSRANVYVRLGYTDLHPPARRSSLRRIAIPTQLPEAHLPASGA